MKSYPSRLTEAPRNSKALMSRRSESRHGCQADNSIARYRFPAEWEHHKATWLAWPWDKTTWSSKLSDVQNVFVGIVRSLHEDEEVHILSGASHQTKQVEQKLKTAGITKNVFFHPVRTRSPWIRDYGPSFAVTKSGKRVLIDWKFNAWGGKYPSLISDDLVPRKIATLRKIPYVPSPVVLEGGSVDVNGRGSCLVTEECLLARNRNPKLTARDLECALKKYLGARHVIWLPSGISGDDTDGHIDCAARFVGPRTVVAARQKGLNGENSKRLEANWERLKHVADQDGEKITAVALPMPGRVKVLNRLIPATYVNFYIANASVLVPVFGVRNDRRALNILREHFPKRRVIGIPSNALAYGLGAIHCVTQPEFA